jgi:hypothetical protein
MTRTRKTRDEYRLHVNYGQGWEHEISEDKFREALARKREYQENCPEYPTKITGPHRVRIEALT